MSAALLRPLRSCAGAALLTLSSLAVAAEAPAQPPVVPDSQTTSAADSAVKPAAVEAARASGTATAETEKPEKTDKSGERLTGCAARKSALQEGPVVLGYAQVDVATGRRVCPRTEVGIGGTFGAIIDTPAFYGLLTVDGLVFGSFAIDEKTEVFATLAPVEYQYAQNGPLKATRLYFADMTIGATRHLHGNDSFLGAVSARLLLPTSFGIPGARQAGIELGHASSWTPLRWLEVHTWLGGDFSFGLGNAPAVPALGGTLTVGAQVAPVDFAALVVDLTGHLGRLSYFAPTAALRFRIYAVSIDIGATLPLAGNDRHDLIFGARFALRL